IEDWVGRYYADKRVSHEPVRRFTLSNSSKCSVQIITYGACITSLKVPDANDCVADVVLGFDSIDEYYKQPYYMGATVGRVSGRIAHGRFVLNNKGYLLAINNPPNHLHGGIRGYDKVVLWESHVQGNVVTLTYVSKDGEEGYPGECVNQATFELTADNELVVSYEVTTTKPCPVSLTNHSYFNLAGPAESPLSIYDHVVTINADKYTPVDRANNIPTGELAPVENTRFDFRRPVKLGDRIKAEADSAATDGFDNNFCIKGSGQRFAAKVSHPGSGRAMEMTTNMPGMQFYTSNFLPSDASLSGRGRVTYAKHSALCLEPQHYPNAVNQPNFPNCILNPGETYEHTTVYKFYVESDKK
uniref:Aldose 1-epimerase n=1 Tax=Strigamia maritima TaxID=126957 RepID=T1JGT1_STRMM